MALITMPTIGIKSIEWTMPEYGGFVVRSGWTAKQTVGDLGNVRGGWKAKVTLTDRKVATLYPWRAFFAAMLGPVNTTFVTAVEVSQGTATPSVYSGVAGGVSSFVMKGLLPNYTTLVAGQLLNFVPGTTGVRMHVLTADLVSDSTGNAPASIYPPAGASYADSLPIEIRSPFCLMRLTTPAGGWSVSPGQIYTPDGFDLEEVIG